MKNYEILHENTSNYIKTDAESTQIATAIQFVQAGVEPSIEKLLVALRTLGFKATQIKVDPVDVFEL